MSIIVVIEESDAASLDATPRPAQVVKIEGNGQFPIYGFSAGNKRAFRVKEISFANIVVEGDVFADTGNAFRTVPATNGASITFTGGGTRRFVYALESTFIGGKFDTVPEIVEGASPIFIPGGNAQTLSIAALSDFQNVTPDVPAAVVITTVTPPSLPALKAGNKLGATAKQGVYSVNSGGFTVATTFKDASNVDVSGNSILTAGQVVRAIDTVTASGGSPVKVVESTPVTVAAAAADSVTSNIVGLTLTANGGTVTTSGAAASNYPGPYSYNQDELLLGKPVVIKPFVKTGTGTSAAVDYAIVMWRADAPAPKFTLEYQHQAGNVWTTVARGTAYTETTSLPLRHKLVASNGKGTSISYQNLDVTAGAGTGETYVRNFVTNPGGRLSNNYNLGANSKKIGYSFWSKFSSFGIGTITTVGGIKMTISGTFINITFNDSTNTTIGTYRFPQSSIIGTTPKLLTMSVDLTTTPTMSVLINNAPIVGGEVLSPITAGSGLLANNNADLVRNDRAFGSYTDLVITAGSIISPATLYNGNVPFDPSILAGGSDFVVGGPMKADADKFGDTNKGWNDKFNIAGSAFSTLSGTYQDV